MSVVQWLPGQQIITISPGPQISSYSEIMEVQRERLGLQIDELSTEILDNARKSNDMSQSLVSGSSLLCLSRDICVCVINE